MRSLVSLASMLVALVVALPAAAQPEAQFRGWCVERSTDEQTIEGCSVHGRGMAKRKKGDVAGDPTSPPPRRSGPMSPT
jgi:hypothetical protein